MGLPSNPFLQRYRQPHREPVTISISTVQAVVLVVPWLHGDTFLSCCSWQVSPAHLLVKDDLVVLPTIAWRTVFGLLSRQSLCGKHAMKTNVPSCVLHHGHRSALNDQPLWLLLSGNLSELLCRSQRRFLGVASSEFSVLCWSVIGISTWMGAVWKLWRWGELQDVSSLGCSETTTVHPDCFRNVEQREGHLQRYTEMGWLIRVSEVIGKSARVYVGGTIKELGWI